jgi:hypothetical protein
MLESTLIVPDEKLPSKLRERLVKNPEISGMYKEVKLIYSLQSTLEVYLALYGKRKATLGIVTTNFFWDKKRKRRKSYFIEQRWFDGRRIMIKVSPYAKNAQSGKFTLKIMKAHGHC